MIEEKGRMMSSMNEKYNVVLHGLVNTENNCVNASIFNLEYDEYRSIVDELEYDDLINRGEWCLSGGYHFMGLTFRGRNFIENNDKKEYHKIEKTEIHNNLSIETNHGIAVAGNDNIINSSEFNQKFTQLMQGIQNSSIENKNQIINELNEHKDDKVALQSYLGTLLTRGAEVAAIVPAIGTLLGMLG
ncbi:hypothetical protein [Sulfurovum sp. NBC37-1]|uniref:hypothetical protein n=1 Tax=Sulfurovum sp. (strain NBC37-1) TaxID=387093 RepID=UPI0011D10529|nr:hypothetical protein [Sulfurovum sp. NBC37-1]